MMGIKFIYNWVSILFIYCLLSPGCATIIKGKGIKNVNFVCSYPLPQEIRIINLKTNTDQRFTVNSNTTKIGLKAHESFFKRSKYQALYMRSGNPTDTINLTPKITPWFWFNLPLGGIWVLIDGKSGAMFQLPKTVTH